jgi:hypothetical protein
MATSERFVAPRPVRATERKQTAAEAQAVYDYVTKRDVTCRAPAIYWAPGVENTNPTRDGAWEIECFGKLERHHAGNKIGTRRITSPRTVVLLCEFHHRTWAPTHSKIILEYLNRVEDAREDQYREKDNA